MASSHGPPGRRRIGWLSPSITRRCLPGYGFQASGATSLSGSRSQVAVILRHMAFAWFASCKPTGLTRLVRLIYQSQAKGRVGRTQKVPPHHLIPHLPYEPAVGALGAATLQANRPPLLSGELRGRWKVARMEIKRSAHMRKLHLAAERFFSVGAVICRPALLSGQTGNGLSCGGLRSWLV